MSELTTHLIVDAGHPAVRIEVLDAGYHILARGHDIRGDPAVRLPVGMDARQARKTA